MLRASRARGERPASPSGGWFPGSLESALALSLALTVVLASTAFLERSSRLSRVLAELRDENRRDLGSTRRDYSPGGPPAAELVVLISLDTLRADHLAAYGYGRETAPILTALASEGVLFRTVCAQASQTLVSHKSLLTGKYPSTLMREETGADLVDLVGLEGDRQSYLVDTFSAVRPTLAEIFRSGGFATCALTDGAWMGRATGFDGGFTTFDDSGGGLEALVPRAAAWLAGLEGARGFLFLHAYDVHCPYPTREPYDSAFCRDHAAHLDLSGKCGKGELHALTLSAEDRAALVDHYDGGIASADAWLGVLFEALRAAGLYERALIVVTSDHGESLGERGVYGHGGLYPEQLLVPLIVKPPEAWKLAPREVSEPIELVDLHPTLLALVHLARPDDLDGRSLVPTLFRGVRGKDYLAAQTTFEEAPEFRSSPAKRALLRPGRWQILDDAERGTAEFFALEHDPLALAPIALGPDELSPLLDLLLEHRPGRRAPRSRAATPVFQPELLRELEALGYGGNGAGHRSSAALR
jgi:arylsulfatase A-like enzyme